MDLTQLKISEFLQELDSSSPAPGGGSVSALAAALGASLSGMVGHLSLGKKKFLAFSPSEQAEFQASVEWMRSVKDRAQTIINQDTEAFNCVMDAFRLPKDTELEKEWRQKKIQEATIQAIDVPLSLAKLGVKALEQMSPIILYGNQNTTSDMGVAVGLFFLAVQGAIYNVRINLPGLSDQTKAQTYRHSVAALWVKAEQLHQSLSKMIDVRL